MLTNYPSNEQLAEMAKLLTQARIENWQCESFGTWRWWILVVLLIAPWPIWYKLADKKRIPEILLFGLIVMVLTITFDETGYVLSLWSYPVEVIPIFPRLTSVNYTVVPIAYMLIYQKFSTWNSFFWAMIAVATLFALVVEPTIVKLGFYVLIKWTYWASFFTYIPMGLLSRWITRVFLDIARMATAK